MTKAQHQYATYRQIDYALLCRKLPKDEKDEHNHIHSIQLLSGILKREFNHGKYTELQELIADYQSKYGPYEIPHFEKQITEGEQISLF